MYPVNQPLRKEDKARGRIKVGRGEEAATTATNIAVVM
jgi:hypothetical protein